MLSKKLKKCEAGHRHKHRRQRQVGSRSRSPHGDLLVADKVCTKKIHKQPKLDNIFLDCLTIYTKWATEQLRSTSSRQPRRKQTGTKTRHVLFSHKDVTQGACWVYTIAEKQGLCDELDAARMNLRYPPTVPQHLLGDCSYLAIQVNRMGIGMFPGLKVVAPAT
jgi:hypothetical protein